MVIINLYLKQEFRECLDWSSKRVVPFISYLTLKKEKYGRTKSYVNFHIISEQKLKETNLNKRKLTKMQTTNARARHSAI